MEITVDVTNPLPDGVCTIELWRDNSTSPLQTLDTVTTSDPSSFPYTFQSVANNADYNLRAYYDPAYGAACGTTSQKPYVVIDVPAPPAPVQLTPTDNVYDVFKTEDTDGNVYYLTSQAMLESTCKNVTCTSIQRGTVVTPSGFSVSNELSSDPFTSCAFGTVPCIDYYTPRSDDALSNLTFGSDFQNKYSLSSIDAPDYVLTLTTAASTEPDISASLINYCSARSTDLNAQLCIPNANPPALHPNCTTCSALCSLTNAYQCPANRNWPTDSEAYRHFQILKGKDRAGCLQEGTSECKPEFQ